MGFLGGIGKAILGGVKKFATSTFGSKLIGLAGSFFGGPIGGALANAAVGLLKGGKLNFKSLVQAGLSAFGGVADKFGLGDIVKNLPAALKNPISLLKNGNLGQIAQRLLGSNLSGKLSNILNTANGFLGKVSGLGMRGSNILQSVQNIFNQLGIKSPAALGQFSDGLSKALGALGKIQQVIGQVNGVLTPMPTGQMLRA